jgi:hypothetical protein
MKTQSMINALTEKGLNVDNVWSDEQDIEVEFTFAGETVCLQYDPTGDSFKVFFVTVDSDVTGWGFFACAALDDFLNRADSFLEVA